MTGPEFFTEAARLVELADARMDFPSDQYAQIIAKA